MVKINRFGSRCSRHMDIKYNIERDAVDDRIVQLE